MEQANKTLRKNTSIHKNNLKLKLIISSITYSSITCFRYECIIGQCTMHTKICRKYLVYSNSILCAPCCVDIRKKKGLRAKQ